MTVTRILFVGHQSIPGATKGALKTVERYVAVRDDMSVSVEPYGVVLTVRDKGTNIYPWHTIERIECAEDAAALALPVKKKAG